ncbi:MAG TPA: non-ribosomal peptide synthase/polyketide synthase [Pyrinomonadaceae bacterium]
MNVNKIEDIYPLSPMQQGMLFHSLYAEDATAYFLQLSCDLHGRLDKAAFARAAQSVVDRHPILRTAFIWEGVDEPLQVVHREAALPVIDYDWRDLSAAEQLQRWETLRGEDRTRGFELAQAPLMRLTLARVSEEGYRLLWSHHHLLLDGWCQGLVMKELFETYEQECGAGGRELVTPRPYRDYIAWLQQQDLSKAENYWRGVLRGFEQPTTILKSNGAVHHETNYKHHRIRLTPEESQLLQERARREQVTMNTVLQGAWALLLSRYSNTADVVFGATVSGRPADLSGVERMIGLFINTLPVRVRVRSEARVWDWLRELQDHQLEMRQYEYSPLTQVQKWSDVEAGVGLFETLLVYENYPLEKSLKVGEKRNGALGVREVELLTTANYPLVAVARGGQEVVVRLDYDVDRLTDQAATQLAEHLGQLLKEIGREGQQSLAELQFLTNAEREQLQAWNETHVVLPNYLCVPQLFEAQVERTPETVALSAGAEQLSYRELNERANQLAHHLRSWGVGPEVIVGICADRSIETVVAMLGTLKAGGAYLPLDPSLPQGRLLFMLNDAGASVLLTQAKLRSGFEQLSIPTLALDSEWKEIAKESSENLPSLVTGENLAYVIYTSGSTGQPKGVLIEHRGLSNYLQWAISFYRTSELQLSPLHTSLSFDLSITSVYPALLSGAGVLLLTEGEELETLATLLEWSEPALMKLTPGHLRALEIGRADKSNFGANHVLVLGGENLPGTSVRWWREGTTPGRLINEYGPTEAVVGCCVQEVEVGEGSVENVAIGRPIWNTQMYVLGRDMELLPAGVTGELYIGGVGLARGYLGNAVVTAERFVPNPFSATGGERLYRTGDLGRYQANGELECFGRVDEQVKIRGYRIELDEIAAVLAQHASVKEAVVIAREDVPGEKRLVGYVVGNSANTAASDQKLYKLPNQLEVAQLNKNETDYIFAEVFTDEIYLKHGITLGDGACVFDAGANIGLFTLFVHERSRGARVFAFEPMPPTFSVLRANVELYDLNVSLFNCGLSNESGRTDFTFYPKMALMSGRYADAQEEERTTRAYLTSEHEELAGHADELLVGRYETQTYDCELRTLSDVIREHGVEQIDLLKVDVEKSELDVLQGIEDQDWPRIKQIVMEVDDKEGLLPTICGLLKQHGFEVTVEQGTSLERTSLYNLYAIHPTRSAVVTEPRIIQPLQRVTLEPNALRDYLRTQLPDYMVPTAIVPLDHLPLTANGKLDRRALPAPEVVHAPDEDLFGTRLTPIEELLAGIWSDVLHVTDVRANDSFFELGGHSLLATQLISRIRETFNLDLPLRTMFELPVLSAFAARIEEALRLEADVQTPPLVRVERGAEAAVSFAQQRLWFIDQLEPNSALYNTPIAVRLTGALKKQALRQTLSEIVRRHEVLRTTFRTVAGEPVQVIGAAVPVQLPEIDLGSLVGPQLEVEVRRLAHEEAERPFDLSRGPLLRLKLVKEAADVHVVLLTMHHIISDGWSMGVFIREVAALYRAYYEQPEAPAVLPELPVQYADFAIWQRGWLQGEALERQLHYWDERLRGAATLELPTDRIRPALPSFTGGGYSFQLDRELVNRVHELSRREGVTIFMTLLAAYQILLARYSGQTDIVVGTDIANRNQQEIEPLIGFFVNELVLRSEVNPNENFQQLLAQVKEVCLGAYAHQDVPFEKLVEELQPERDLGRAPLFQVKLVLQNAPAAILELPELRLSGLGAATAMARFELMLTLTETEQGMVGSWSYSRDLFDETTIARLTRHYERVLQTVTNSPQKSLASIEILTRDEQRQLLADWNDTRHELGPTLIHESFAQQAEQTPDAAALIFGAERLNYAELNTRANQVAHYLRATGVGPEVIVGLFFERSIEMVIALLGILKAGAAYLPIDPEYPLERISFMLEDANVPVLLTHEAAAVFLPAYWGQTIYLDSDWAMIAAGNAANPEPIATAENPAYVLYTSGSTGQPKGVVVPHRAIANHMQWMLGELNFSANDRVLQKTPYTFDASVWEFYAPLMSGGALVIAPPNVHRDAAALINELTMHQITQLQLVPTMLKLLIEEPALNECNALQRVFCGGEALTVDLVQRFRDRRPSVELCNLYGPTEATIDASIWSSASGSEVTLGRPIWNTEMYVLGRELELLPIGVAGELYIGGDGLARGYIGRSELTAERFVPHLYSPVPGARLYRTGDLVRYRVNGELEYLGRADEQVKLRGFRIELGEIEVVLQRHAAVRECVVVVREDVPGDKRLVGYVVKADDVAVQVAELREHLRASLPEYMTPSAIVWLESLPLTNSGKIDRRALPDPETISLEADDAAAAMLTPIEEILAGVWSEVLHVPQVKANDNFFELGGHSLLATQLVSRIREILNVELPLRVLFETPVLSAVAKRMEQELRVEAGVQASPLQRVERGVAAPMSFAQQRLWFIDQLEPNSTLYNSPLAVRLSGELKKGALEQTLTEIVRRHEVLRTTFQVIDGEAMQVIGVAGPVQLPEIDLSALDETQRESQVGRLAQEEANQPFDLAHGPLLRFRLLREQPDEHVVLVTMHHIISDGWSMGVLINEVATLYRAYYEELESPLPELDIQYADFAVWQRDWLQGDALERQLEYWEKQLRDAATLDLPTDRPRAALPTYRGGGYAFMLGPELTGRLHELSRHEGVTLFMTLLAGFQILLSRYSGQPDIVVGTDIANRNRQEIEPLVGFFVNQLVMRSEIRSDENFRDFLARVREICLGAYAHQDVPFEKLVEELRPERDLSRSPLYQVKLVLQNAPGGELELPGLRLSRVGGGPAMARWDLLLTITEIEEGLLCSWSYNSDLFDEATMVRLTSHYARVLLEVTADTERSLGSIDLLTQAERQQLFEWNETSHEIPATLVHERFAAQAKATPAAIALSSGDEQLTYEELDQRTNQLAHYLTEQGIRPEQIVAVCMERSIEIVVALLGTLKAGAAYLPVEPSLPQTRIDFMLADASAATVLTQSKLMDRFDEVSVPKLCLDRDWEVVAKQSTEDPAVSINPENLAYVIYTSGSTGQPKGVLIEHRNFSNYLSWATDFYRTGQLQLSPLHTSLSFDLGVTSLYPALLSGAGVLLLPETEELESLAALLEWNEPALVKLTPAHLQALEIGVAEPKNFGAEHVLVLGGENLPGESVRWWRDGTVSGRLINEYGPTEATVGCCVHEVVVGENATESVAIGRPIANAQMYVLGREQELLPAGVTGELYIGGAGLARGYLGNAVVTAEKFIPNPYSATGGERLYRTGDLGRYSPSGEIEYLGRADEQVKLRGYRIELGEIEAVLRRHDAVRECVVIAREDAPGDKRLVGYVTTTEVSADELREHLRASLPEYMVPSAIVALDNLPLSASGKIDRRALPAPEIVGAEDETIFGTVLTPTEEILAGIWSEVLRVGQIHARDNFFELGGHSLLATQLISRIRAAFKIELPLRTPFEAPVLSELAARIDESLRAEAGMPTPPLVRTERGAEAPLSFAQQRLWFIEQLEPESALYDNALTVRLSGHLHKDALQRTFTEIVRRHEVLRTTFRTINSVPMQIVAEASSLPLLEMDLSELEFNEREGLLLKLVREESARAFDLTRGPLLRLKLVKLAAEEHVVLLTMHHIISDGWSMGVFVREVATLYRAYYEGRESPLPELEVQYADFAMWQKSWLHGDLLALQLHYWNEQLRGAALLELPTDRPRPALPTYRGGRHVFNLDRELSKQLHALSRHEGATLFMTLLATFQVLLSRYSGQADIIVGTDIANRNRHEIEPLIGFFVNQLVLRTEVKGEESFRGLLARVRELCLGAYAHQDVPFEKLVEELQPERDLNRAPLFQVKLILQNAPGGQLELPELTLSRIGGEDPVAQFDLLLSITESEQGLSGLWSYSSDLFDRSTIARMTKHLVQLLSAIVVDIAQPVAELPLMSAAEVDQLREWNDTKTEWSSFSAVHQFFEQQVEWTPEATAVIFEDQQLSYRELNGRANQVAHYLQELGVGPEVVVGLCFERSIELVVGLLGVLKAGGAYLPIDPGHPLDRISFMLEDSGVPVLLSQERLVDVLPSYWGQTILLDNDWDDIASRDNTNLEIEVLDQNAVYSLYTSGTTGLPKGVLISQRALLERVHAMIDTYQLTSADRMLQFVSPSFDAFAEELFPTICCGATLIMSRDPGLQDASALLGLIDGLQITTLHIPTPSLHQLVETLEHGRAEAPQSVRLFITGGESPAVERVAQWIEMSESRTRFVVAYGPTEAAITATTYAVPEQAQAVRDLVRMPIGRPLPNSESYILDERLELLPVGVIGELYLGGIGLARGYVGRPELTATQFVPNPHSSEPGARMYRTGDQARYLIDGTIEFLGRSDEQVKIRGYRIELGEIEAVLRRHAAVRESVVIAREDTPGDKRLVGYIVPSGQVGVSELRMHLRASLPEYMVPGAIVMLDELPLTVHGKVDRRALPAPEEVREEEAAKSSSLTPIEEMVAGIWLEVLPVTQIKSSDNFFEIGGHSLLATQVVSRIREVFQIDLPLRVLFEAPVLSGLALCVETEMRAAAGMPTPPLMRAERGAEAPLSFAQQRLWFIDQLEPDNPFYNNPSAVRLTGELDKNALQRTLTEIVRRHEILRTTFKAIDGTALQVVAEPDTVQLPEVDLSELSEVENVVQQLAHAEASRPFDLTRGPLVRLTLLKIAEEEHVVLLTLHHIISDGWSMGVFINEVATLYRAYREGRESPLPDLDVQYADFAIWQRSWLKDEVLDTHLRYWEERLRDAATLDLPTDRVRTSVPSYRGARSHFAFGPELSEQLHNLSRREGATLFMTVLAAYQLLLSRYSGQNDIVIGTDIANRNYHAIEPLIGFFVNQLVLRTEVRSEEPFSELLARVRETSLGAYAHQDVPFEKLVEELQPERHLNRSPLFQAKLVLQNMPVGQLELPGLTLSGIGNGDLMAQFDLLLAITESEQGLNGTWSYSKDLFERATIERLSQHLLRLLGAVVAEGTKPVGELALLNAEEVEQLLEWNDTQRDWSSHTSIQQLFEARALQSPTATALIFESERLSYGELNERANQLAHYLKERQVGPEVIVGLCLDRGIELIVGILGVLKAGGAYLPIDPNYPKDRIAWMLADAGVAVLLTQEKLQSYSSQTICLDTQWSEIATRPATNPESKVSDQNAVYLLYTSGTTGQPKGVLIQQRSLLERVHAMIETYQFTSSDRMLQFVSPSFDAFGEELFPTLCSGGSLVLTHDPGLQDPAELLDLIRRLEVTTLHMPPGSMNPLLDAIDTGRAPLPESVRLYILGGESASPERTARWIELSEGRTRFAIAYGPTEAVITATVFPVPEHAATVRQLARMPIGRPLANTETYILDERLELLPVGVIGELYIGGVGLARGYVGRPELTATQFVPNPHSTAAGARLYRTGDQARYLADGTIEFLGRRDEQVKIRGFRIELGEIEAVLRRHEAVNDCLVIAVEDSLGDKRLVGYVVASSPVGPGELRSHLRASLPDYMTPGAIVLLDEFPLNVHGKIDRKALPAPQALRDDSVASALTPIEEMLANIWLEVLPVTQIRPQENFFELGGHSLLATQVVSRIRTVFHVDLPLRALFEAPVLSELARYVEALKRAGANGETPPLVRAERGAEAPLSFAQQRLWFIDQLEPGNSLYNNPLAVRLRGEFNQQAFEQTLTEIVRRHEVLRTTFRLVGGEPRQVVAEPAPVYVTEVDLSEASEVEASVRQFASEEALAPFDLSRGPLLRAKLLRLTSNEHVLLLTMHHIVADAWSIGVFIDEVATLYRGYCEPLSGRQASSPAVLPELPVQYADFAIWQRNWLQGEALDRQLAYWGEQLRDAATLELPTDRPRTATPSHKGAEHSFELTPEVAESLRQLSRREGATLFMTVLAAFQALLARCSGQSDIVVGTDIANRNRQEIEPLIGFFVNQLVLRTEVNADENFRELLGRVREVCLGAYAHQDVPFEKLVEELQPQRDLSRSPLFQVKLGLQTAVGTKIELPGLTLSGLGDETAMARFDLLLSLTDSEHGLTGSWVYSTDLFDDSTIARMSTQFVRVLEAVTANADLTVAELPLLSDEEQSQLLFTWNDTQHPTEQLVSELFAQQVKRTPEAVALSYGAEQLSYYELNRRANQLAHYLREFGVGPEVIVGVCAERSIEMVVSLFAILKAGGAYLPVDPNYPAARISFLLEDANVSVVLTQKKLSAQLLNYWGQTIFVDTEWDEIASYSDKDLAVPVDEENLAYVIYTSGSTGQPKGVLVHHRGLANYLSWATDFYRTNEVQVSPLHGSISFDLSVTSLYPALLTGATVKLVAEGSELEELGNVLAGDERALIKLTPSHLRALGVGEGEPNVGAGHVLVVGGESLPGQTVRWWREGTVGSRLINEYGPTEAVVGCCIHEVEVGERADSEVSIGRPIWNTQMYVLGRDQELLPLGAIGELYIGGEGLARGYLGRPDQTAERFIPNPYSKEIGARLYRTGDRGRYLANGEIEYLGRADEQVKVRGYRIELGEVEAALARHASVRDCVVIAREERLVGYVIAADGVTVNELREHLRSSLPEYMVPSIIVLIDQIPLTPNGKVDRSALPTPDPSGALLTSVFVAPRTELEGVIAAIWQSVLGLEKVGINDNFFDLGGHSLLLVKVYSQLRAETGIELPMLKLFEYPTVSSLAAFLSGETAEEQTPLVDEVKVELRKTGMKQRRKARTAHRLTTESLEVSGD